MNTSAQLKTCHKCGQQKDLAAFCKHPSGKNGLSNKCRTCASAYLAAYYANNKAAIKEKQTAYVERNQDRVRIAKADYYLNNSEKIKVNGAERKAKDPEKIKTQKASYYKKNRESIRVAKALYNTVHSDRIKIVRDAYYAKNKERIQCVQAAYRAKDPEKTKASKALSSIRYVAKHPEKVKERKAAYHAANPEVSRIDAQNRRARKRNSGGVLSAGLSKKLFGLQRGLCPCCVQPLGEDFQLDHVMPLALGGINVDSNIQLLRHKCNKQKHAKHPIDFMQSRGFLL